MSTYRTRRAATKVEPPAETSKTIEVATYVGELLKGVRELTRPAARRDLAFLDYLLAMAEEESGCLTAHVYH